MNDDKDKLTQFQNEVQKDFNLTEEQRIAANEDTRFIHVDGGMWEDFAQGTHGYDSSRARMEFDIVSDFVNRFNGEWSQNRANVAYTPDDTKVSEDDAELLTGIYRSEFNDNDGGISQDNAVGEVSECGYGAFKLSTRFVDEEDPENQEQEIIWEPIFNACNTVIWSSNAKRIDKADARHCTLLVPYTPEEFKSEWPDATPASAPTPHTLKYFDWNTPEEITVAERYEIKIVETTVHVYEHVEANKVESYPSDEVEKIEDELKADGWTFVRERKVKLQTVEKSVFSGAEFLEEPRRISGKFIPIIPMYGYHRYVDSKERYRGLVRKLKDAARYFNMNLSRMADAAASSPDSKPIFTRKQIKGREDDWANPEGAYRVINDLEDANGNIIPAGPVGYEQPIQIDPNTLGSTQIIDGFVQRTTGGAPQEVQNPDASGKAINALRARENLNTQPVADNILLAIKHSGDVYRSIASEVHADTKTKRVTREDGKASLVTINASILDEDSGEYVDPIALSKGRFKSLVRVGPQYESQREATVATMQEGMSMVGPESDYFNPMMSVWALNIAGTGTEGLKEFARKKALMSGFVKPETDEEKQMLAEMDQEVDPQTALNESITNQQNAEAENLQASARNKDADTMKKKAETAEIVVDIGAARAEQAVKRFKYNPATGMLDADSRVS